MKLLIVIPALNEQSSIENIITRTHSAIPEIKKRGNLSEVKIVVVSDGSTDKTVEMAQKHIDKIKLIVFEKNKGYGAAIKEGWEQEEADLLGFIDADGTCNPEFFADLCDLMNEKNADVALGNRLNKQSKMPFIRKTGNIIFSTLLSLASAKKIKDTASGMRVVRKKTLWKLMPLPNGLHFTPAMSARAILSNDLIIVEKDMPYHERQGESKLNVWEDGKRFLSVIIENTFIYIPHRIFALIGTLLLLCSVILIFPVIYFYLDHSFLEEWMFYRFIVSCIFSVCAILLFFISNLAHNIVHFTTQPEAVRNKTLFYYLFEHKLSLFIASVFYLCAFALVFNSIWSRLTTGLTNEHWSRYLAFLFFFINGTIFVVSYFTNKILGLIKNRVIYLQSVFYGNK